MVDMSHFSQDFWDERYHSRDHLWSGRPNRQLVAEVTELTPGRALDVACGEGADAIWLAEQGWTVTGIDISPVALERARAHGQRAGAGVPDRLSWRQVDLFAQSPEPLGQHDLVSAQFLHLPPAVRSATLQRLASAVVEGGHLLFVTHDPADLEIQGLRPPVPDMFVTAEHSAALLDAAEWEILVAESRGRSDHVHEGVEVTVHDAVLHARRR